MEFVCLFVEGKAAKSCRNKASEVCSECKLTSTAEKIPTLS
jgi:hypothetical protein